MFESSGAARHQPLRGFVVATLLLVGCGDDAGPVEDYGPPTQFDDDEDAGGGRDAGPRDAGRRDAGRHADAGGRDSGPQGPDAFAICPTVSGLGPAAGATFDDAGASALVLTNDADGTDADETLEVTEDGKHCFANAVVRGGKYRVAIQDDPTFPFQTCAVSGASGTVVAGDVTSVTVDCAVDRFTVGGSVSGLGGTLVLSLRDEGGTELAEITLNATDATYASAAFPSGQHYQMVVKAQPSAPVQTCVVARADGQIVGADVTHVNVTCTTPTFTVSGTVLNHGGSMTLQNAGENDLVVPSGATTFMFTAPVASGDDYDVEVSVPPTNGACLVTHGMGTITDANVSDVEIECTITDVFAATGAMQTFVVPAGVTSVDLEVYGAQGAIGGHFPIPAPPAPPPPQTGGPGGLGAKATGTLAVTPGQTLYLFVGGSGTDAAAGFNGGGNGGVGDLSDPLGYGGGGGASDVRIGGTTLAERIITAGGGGGGGGAGSGGSCDVALQGGPGGSGGGGNGGNGENASGAGGGGLGATGSTAGSEGTGCAAFLGGPGTSGATGIGGDGGNGQACCCAMDPSGGGGGGGFVGGGGGGGASAGSVSCFGSGKGGGGGGAGGTSDVSGVSAGAMTSGVHSGAGEIRVIY